MSNDLVILAGHWNLHTLSANILTAKIRQILKWFLISLDVEFLSFIISAVEFYFEMLHSEMFYDFMTKLYKVY